MPRVTFISQEDATTVHAATTRAGQTLLQVAHAAGIDVIATCGGRGRCQSCRIKALEGDLPPATVQDRLQLGQDAVREHFRLACQTKIIADCSVLVAPPTKEIGHQVLVNGPRMAPEDGVPIDSGVEKYLVTPRSPEGVDTQLSDAERLMEAAPPGVSRRLPLDVVRDLPASIRGGKGDVTITAFNGTVIEVAPGDTRGLRYGMAFDIGTTTIVGTLLDLGSGEQLASVANINPQSTFGGDLMSRIAFAQFNRKNLATLRARVLQTLNDFIGAACREAGVPREQIYKVVIVGNTCMHHLLLGIDVTHLGFAPYAPAVRDAVTLSARELPLKSAPRACICLLPLVAGFVGADTVGALLATGINGAGGTRLLVDIGTNTEVVMATEGRLVACSAPAGPAFEGGQIRHGMRAAIGAIEAVDIDADLCCKVIGDTPAIGVCGSGLIDAAAKLLDAGVIEPNGLLRQTDREGLPSGLRNRFREGAEGGEFVLVPAAQSGRGEDVTLTQGDIRQLQLAKGAIYSAILMLQRVTGVGDDQVEELLLCGGFGNYINVESAVRIRMLPRLGPGRIRYVGNAAHAGAEMALMSESARTQAETLAQRVTHVSLAEHPDYQDIFVDALGI